MVQHFFSENSKLNFNYLTHKIFFFFFFVIFLHSNLPICRTDSPLISKCSQEFTNSRAPLWFHSPPYFWGLRVGKHGVTILAFWRLSWLDLAEHPRTCWGSDSSVELRWSRWTVLGSWESAKRQWISKRQHPAQPQSVHPAAVWQAVQEYPVPFHQTTEQLLFLRPLWILLRHSSLICIFIFMTHSFIHSFIHIYIYVVL